MNKVLVSMVVLLAGALASQAAVVLDTTFAGFTTSLAPDTISGFTWTSSMGEAGNATTDLVMINKADAGFITMTDQSQATANTGVGVRENLVTRGSWSTSFIFTPSKAIDMTDFTISTFAIGGLGTHQDNSRTMTWDLTISSSSGTALTDGVTLSDPGGNSPIDYALGTAGVRLDANTAYTFYMTISTPNGDGVNVGLDNMTLNGVVHLSAQLDHPTSWPTTFLENAPQSSPESSGISSAMQVAQSFTLLGDALLESVVIELDDLIASADLTGSLLLEIVAADALGFPSETVYVSMEGALPSGLSTGSLIEFNLPSSVALTVGNYVLTLTSTDADLVLNSTSGDLFNAGQLLEKTGADWAVATSGHDLVFGLTGSLGELRPVAASGPNVIFVLVDDWGWTDHSSSNMALGYQSDFYQTPNFERLVDAGVAFTSTYVQPNCAPTRAALFSGQYSCRTGNGVYNVGSLSRAGSTTYTTPANQGDEHVNGDEQSITLAEAFYNSGYITAHLGKFHVGSSNPTDPTFPLNQGFDFNYGGGSQGNPGYPSGYWSDGTQFHNNLNGGFDAFAADYDAAYVAANLAPYANGNDPTTLVGTHKHLTDATADSFVSFMNAHRSGATAAYPVYVQFHFYAVHNPVNGRPDLVDKYTNLPDGIYNKNDGYAALIEGMDHSLGRIMDYLDDPNGDGNTNDSMAAETLLVFCSDNGGYDPTVNTPLRGKKGMHYDGGIRVPCVIQMPGTLPAGIVSDTLIHAVDFYPTLLDFAGGVVPDPTTHPLDGVSLYDHLLDPEHTPRNREPIFYHFPGYMDNRTYACSAVIKDTGGKRYKYIYAYDPYYNPGSGETLGFDQYQLYNLTDDIGETVNLLDYIDLEDSNDPNDPSTAEEYWNYILYKDIAADLAADLNSWLDHGSPNPSDPDDPTWVPLYSTYKDTFPGIAPELVGQETGPAPASIPEFSVPDGQIFKVLEGTPDEGTQEVTLEFTSAEGFTYAIETSTNLVDWAEIESEIPGQADSMIHVVSDPALGTGNSHFYRILVLP